MSPDVRNGAWRWRSGRTLSLGGRLHLLIVVPLLLVTVVIGLITAGGLSSNARRLQGALVVEGKANRVFALLLVQEDTTKAILLDPSRLPDYSAAKLAAYDEHKELLGQLESRLTDPQVLALLDEIERIDAEVLRPVDTLILEQLFVDSDAARKLYFERYEPSRAEYEANLRRMVERARTVVEAETRQVEQRNLLSLGKVVGVLFLGIGSIAVTIHVLSARVERGQTQLERTAVAARAASETKSAFLARVSHELRTPLNAILGYAELIDEEADVCSARGDAHHIQVAATHLLGVVDSVLDLSQVEAGRMDLHTQVVSTETLVTPVTDTMRPLAARNRNQLEVQIEPGLVCVDVGRVRQVLLNLLANACRFTEGGTVAISVHLERGLARFVVTDTGIGIRAERLPHLFQPFVQAEADTRYRYGGTGLGLALCDGLVRTMGGHIEVVSTPGKGSRFTVVLPQAAPEVVSSNTRSG